MDRRKLPGFGLNASTIIVALMMTISIIGVQGAELVINPITGELDVVNTTASAGTITDTNASTACAAGEVLLGDGTCTNLNETISYEANASVGGNYSLWENITNANESVGQLSISCGMIIGNTSALCTIVDTNTYPGDVFVNESGDIMSGKLEINNELELSGSDADNVDFLLNAELGDGSPADFFKIYPTGSTVDDYTGINLTMGMTDGAAVTITTTGIEIINNVQATPINFYGLVVDTSPQAVGTAEYSAWLKGGAVRIGDAGTLNYVEANDGDGDLYVEDELEVDGNAYLASDLTVAGGDITGANGEAIDIGEATNDYITFTVNGKTLAIRDYGSHVALDSSTNWIYIPGTEAFVSQGTFYTDGLSYLGNSAGDDVYIRQGALGISSDGTTPTTMNDGDIVVWDGAVLVCDGENCGNTYATIDGEIYSEYDLEVDGNYYLGDNPTDKASITGYLVEGDYNTPESCYAGATTCVYYTVYSQLYTSFDCDDVCSSFSTAGCLAMGYEHILRHEDSTITEACSTSNFYSKHCTCEQSESCFPAGSQVTMADGTTKNIEDIRIGEYVLSYDLTGQETVIKQVTELETPYRDHMITVEFDDGSQLRMTDEHPVLTQRGWASFSPENTYRERQDLEVVKLQNGDYVKTENDWKQIIGWLRQDGGVQTYNLKNVEDTHTFFVEGSLVHNKCILEGTMVDMLDGSQKAVEEVVPGDYVAGGRVLSTYKKGMLLDINGKILPNGAIVTSNHIILWQGEMRKAGDIDSLEDIKISSYVYDLETTTGRYSINGWEVQSA